MPNSINIPTPPALTGAADNKIGQLHTYLFRFAEQMAMILNSIEAGASPGGTQVVQGGSGDVSLLREQMKQQLVNTAAQLRKEANEQAAQLRKETGEAVQAAAPRRGMASCTAALASGAYEDIAVSFGEALSAVPVVAVGLISPGTDGAYSGGVSASVVGGSVSTQGFTVRVANNSGSETAANYSVAWIAAI